MSRLSNRTIILGFALLAAISLTFGILNFHKALPEIGIDFKVSRAEALQNAREFMASRSYNLTGFREHIRFSYAGDAKIYLERELGVEKLTSLAEDSLDVWRWVIRFYKPLQKLEYRVMIDPKGRPVAFRRELGESVPGPTMDTLSARTLAEAYISGPMAQDLDKWTLIETGVADRPARRDYTFTYELNGFKAKEATYRMETIVQGAEVAGFRRYLREPEDWWRGWEKQRSQNELFQTLARVAAFLTLIGIFFYFFKHVKQSQIPWKLAIGLGVALSAAHLVMGLNSIPLAMGGYQTTQSFSSFMTMALFNVVIEAFGQGMLLILLLGAGEWLYRQDYPEKLSLAAFFTKRGMKSREFFQATVMGYLLCAFDVGLVVAIYMLGSKVGFWSPADIKYDETVSTVLPWIAPLAISLGASLLEEFWFRLFGISLFKRLTKSTALAIIIPAFIWGFLHSSYPQQPGFARGIEVGIVGIIAGLVMLRFGIWATLVYHYLFDAVMIGLFLFRSHDVYFWVSGLVVCGFLLAPAVIAGVIYLRKRKFEEVDDLLNRNVLSPEGGLPEVPATPEPVYETNPIQSNTPLLGQWARVIGVIGIALAFIPGPRGFGDNFKLNVPISQAVEKARETAEATYGVKLDGYKAGVSPLADNSGFKTGGNREYTMAYIKRYGTLEDAERLLLNPDGPFKYTWGVKFQKEYDPTEYNCFVTMDAGRSLCYLQIADSLAGADLEPDSARALASAAFEKGEPEAAKFHLIEEKPIKRPHRRDYFFVWETTDPILKEAHFRRNVTIKGDIVTLGNRWIKVPEEWERSEKELTLGVTLIMVLATIAVFALGGWIIARFGKAVKKGNVVWKDGVLPAIIVLLAGLATAWNKLPSFWFDYESSKPVANFLLENSLMTVVGALASAGFAFVLVVLAQALASGAAGRRMSIFHGDGTPGSASQDVFAALGVTGVMLGVRWLLNWLTGRLNLPQHTWDAALPEALGRTSPLLEGLTNGVEKAFVGACLLLVVFLLVDGWAKQWWKQALILVLVGLTGLAGESMSKGNLTAGEMAWAFLQMLVLVAAGYYSFRVWIGFRLRAAALALVLIALIKLGIGLVGVGGSLYLAQGAGLLCIAAVLPIVMIMMGRRGES